MITYYRTLAMFILVHAAIFLLQGCTKEKDPCDDTKWDSTVNYSVQPKLFPANAVLPDGKILKEASNLTYFGIVRKYHCSGTISADYTMESQHDPRAIDNEYWTEGFAVGKVYGFDFDNDEDYLEYQYSLLVFFDDGSVYELPVQLDTAKPPFIPDWTKSYYPALVNADMVWVQKR